MKKKGFTLIELLVVIAIIAMLLAILMPALNKVKKIAQRVVCGTNLKGLGTAQTVYANDYDDAYTVQGGQGSHTWGPGIPVTDGFAAASKDWTDQNITVGASLYLLVREADVSPKSFVCGAGGQTDYEGENPQNRDITELWDFGSWQTGATDPDIGKGPTHGPKGHVSYSFQMPYGDDGRAGRHAADGTKSAAFAVMADKNPWFDPKLQEGPPPSGGWTQANFADYVGPLASYWTDTGMEKFKIQRANSYPHSREGQNVLFGDGHASYEKTSDIGVKHDNIYTIRVDGTEDGTRRGDPIFQGINVSTATNLTSNDSYLVNDDMR